MALELGTAYISILPETSKLTSGLKSSLKTAENDAVASGKKMGSGLGAGIKKGLQIGLVGLAAVGVAGGAFLKGAIDSASDFNETMSKMETIFGKQSKNIAAFGKNAATSLGMSRQEALAATSTFGNFFNQIGIGTRESAKMSQRLVVMSADLASFNNANPAEVMDALSSATRGEYDALQRFIPTINAAKVQQEALNQTGKDSVKTLTDQDKARALYALALKGQGKAEGDFARTSTGLANQQRILTARFADLKVTIGSALLPVAVKTITFVNNNMIPALKSLAGWVSDNSDLLRNIGIAVGIAATAFGVYALTVSVVSKATAAWAIVQKVLNGTLRANPIGLVVTAIALLAAGLVVAYKKSDTFRKIVDKAWAGIKKAIAYAWNNVIKPIFTAWKDYYENVLFPVIKFLWNNVIKPVFGDIGTGIKYTWNNVIKPVFQALGSFIKNTVAPAFKKGVDAISKIWDSLKKIALTPVNFLIGTVYNKGIVPLVNNVAEHVNLGDKVHLSTVPKIHMASGGVMPGYTPGRDVHDFYSPTGGRLALSGGEAIMRPEWTKAVGGPGAVEEMNRRARKGIFHFAKGGVFRPTASGGYGSLHDQWTGFPALDIGVGTGTPVHAVHRGVVSRSEDIPGWNAPGRAGSYGRVIQIKSGGFEALFAHLSQRLVDFGQQVMGGQLIGYSGSTGNSTGPHLHFGVKSGSPYTFMGGSTNYPSGGASGGGSGGLAGNIISALISRTPAWALQALGQVGTIKQGIKKAAGMAGVFGQTFAGGFGAIAGGLKDWIKDKISGFSLNSITGHPSGYQEYALNALASFGFPSSQWEPLKQLWEHESGWNPTATNPAGGNPATSAYGIPQAYPGSKMASAGKDWQTNPETQIKWGLAYIKSTYGSPAAAWAHWMDLAGPDGVGGTYDSGGILEPGGIAINASSKPEAVFTNRQFKDFAREAGGGNKFPNKIQLVLADGTKFDAYIRGIATNEIEDNDAFMASRRRQSR